MKFLKLFFMLAMVMALEAITLSTSISENSDHRRLADSQMPTSFGGAGGFRPFFTCDKRPEICSTKGQFCCNRRCVDLKTDQYNCGRCGRTCNYSKICCEGKCVSPLSNEKHCGGCNNNCGKGSSSRLDMTSQVCCRQEKKLIEFRFYYGFGIFVYQ
ncbi:hypothetical protein ES319_D05G181100v1 [Gossypium barbadense]|uniref:Stigma-specific STIG1-like protein 1 n=2 Tax=Gossypium TaxID=3633 RepID=A0A5J5RF13_GOSBA|nr:hypothetical protein ES319_D05G181100v1 [Gossypium barbadense]TYG68923.1 hypothetical protein ES288_D05G191000v1 [Gossypium darwinii]